jgi:tubulin--tyrosine ligase-like protein 12
MEPTYILDEELNEFIGEYKHRKDEHIDNLWIIKPVNLARSLDTIVTSNLDQILKVMETGPKIAQKYIERPLLYKGKKHDFRFIIPVRSIRPLEAYIYNTFWLRASNNPYTLDRLSFNEYETHFTVMNYRSKYKDCPDSNTYLQQFPEHYGTKVNWDTIYNKIKKVIYDALVASQVLYPQFGKENVFA